MAETTTTTTTEAPTTTTTTTEAPSGKYVAGSQEDQAVNTTNDTVESMPSVSVPAVEKRGEVVVDSGANAKTLKEQSSEERIANAQNEALVNHSVEHEADESPEERVSRDKVA